MLGSFLTTERCDTCHGNVECDETFVVGTFAYIRTWTCLMCGREKHPAELRAFSGRLLAQQVPTGDGTLRAFVWDRELKGVY